MGKIKFDSIQYKGYSIYKIFSEKLGVTTYALNAEKIKGKIEMFQNKIPVDRYRKMLKYSNKIDQMLLIGNEILFEYGMHCLKPDQENLQIERAVDEAGKPYIKGFKNIYFNMSHAGKYSVCAFSDRPLGVDIECIAPIDLTIAKRHYCEEEYKDIMENPIDSQLKRFYQYWVLKESFTKAVGLGLSIPLNVFRFQNRKSDGILTVEHKINDHEYLSQQFCFTDSLYEMAICIQTA